MTQNIVEHLRELAIDSLFQTKTFQTCWVVWQSEMNALCPTKTPRQILDLGDHLSDIFATTKTGGRSQGEVSSGGTAWESLACWYLNLCLVGRRTIVIKHHKRLIPTPVSDAITVNYNNFISNTESDLIAITFPDEEDYKIDKERLHVLDENGILVPLHVRSKYNFLPILNALTSRDFAKLEIHVIQCKTNWNDNAQIPMLWDMIYSAKEFKSNIKVGRNGYSIHDIRRFTYSFVTVPTSSKGEIKPNAAPVERVSNISGGNYWGKTSKPNVASSIKEMLGRNLSAGHKANHLSTIGSEISKLNIDYQYFNL